MRQSLKISLSLLIALVLFAAFSVLAFRGLFDYMQVAFFQPRVLQSRGVTLEAAAGVVERYHQRNVERFQELLQEPFIAAAFSAAGQQSREDIFNRGNLFGRLLEEYPNLLGVRFLDPDGEKVHFSTFRQDASFGGDRKTVTYLDFSRSEPALKGAPLLVRSGEEPRLLVDGGGGRLIYSFPVADLRGALRGTALFFFSAKELESSLAREAGLAVRGLLLVDRLGVLVHFPDVDPALLAPSVASSWTGRPQPADSQDSLELGGQGTTSRHLLLSRPAGRYGLVGWLVPYTEIELHPLLKIILLAAVLLTVFLLVFLIFNIRQDPQVLLARRIKRVQLDILAELVAGKEQVDWKRWHDKLAAGRAEWSSLIKRGVGRIPPGKQAEVDGLIDRGWDEIIGIIEARLSEHGREKVAISQIEEMIQKALDRGRFTVAGTLPAVPAPVPVASVPAAPSAAPPRAEALPREQDVAPRRESLVVEEIGVEEVSEAGEPSRRREPAAAEIEEVEELEEAEELTPEPAAAETEEAAEVEEAEEAEEIEEVAPQAAEASQEAALAEEVPEAEAVAEPAVAPPGLGREPAIAAREAAVPEPAVEELETVGEILVLPPEPQEKLEELLPVEEAVREEPAARKPVETEAAVEELESLEALEEVVAEEPEPEAEAAELRLESVETEPQAIKELLESPAELEMEDPAAARQPGDEQALLDRMVSQGALRAFSLAELEAQVQEHSGSVVMQNGVYRVKEELRLGRAQPRERGPQGRGLKSLAEAALIAGGEEESGIGALLGSASGVDLFAELGSPAAQAERTSYSDPRQAKKIHFSDGLDYDQYLLQFRDGASETGSMKSLVEISRKIKAVNAALLIKTGSTFVSRLRVGLLEKPERILLSAGEPFYDRFLSQRQAVLLAERPQDIPSLAAHFNPEDLKYMRMALFLPAIYQKTQAVLFLGLPVSRPLEMKDIIRALDIHV